MKSFDPKAFLMRLFKRLLGKLIKQKICVFNRMIMSDSMHWITLLCLISIF